MKIKSVILKGLSAAGLLALVTSPMYAAPVEACAIATGSQVDGTYASGSLTSPGVPTGANSGCNDLITFNSDGSIGTTNPNGQSYFDIGGDDTLVGVINNTSSVINAITLSSTDEDIVGFDADGACSGDYSFDASGAGGTLACLGATDPSGYAPAGVSFNILNSNFGSESVVVDFAGGIAANGGTAWFSLEDPVDLSQQTVSNGSTPEPGTIAMLFGGLGLVAAGRRRFSSK